MFNTMFQQQPYNPYNFGNYGYPQNNGVAFNQVAPAKQSTSTAEEMAIIKSAKKSNFSVSAEELAKFGWDLRDGKELAIEITDPSTERVRIKYTGEEFNIVIKPVEVLTAYLDGLKNFVYTTALLNTSDNPEVLKELLTAAGVVTKLLPIAYEDGKKNYSHLTNQLQNMMTAQGYQGNWGGMYNGVIGSTPNYVVNESAPMVQPAFMQQPMMQQPVQPAFMQQPMMQQPVQPAFMQQPMMQQPMNMQQQPMMNMGTPTVPNGGTMMGGNPFTQNGAPQAATNNTVPNLNSIPAPGTPVNSANPAMGTTTASVKI